MSDQPVEVGETFLLVNVVDKNVGDLAMETNDGKSINEQVIVLTLRTMDPETMAVGHIDLAIPQSCGPELLMNLLTDEQFDAAMNAEVW